MYFLDKVAILVGKLVILVSRLFNLGYGGTWPGEVALFLAPDILQRFNSRLLKGIILVAGTNGKTTTSLMLKSILEQARFRVIHNSSGANLQNGLVSAFINKSSFLGSFSDFNAAVLEVDENTLPLVLDKITPRMVICLNLFRDQLDRYGEVDVISRSWHRALKKLPSSTTVILNADDPQIAYLSAGLKSRVIYFGINDPVFYRKKLEHATDSIFCLACRHRLNFRRIYFSHLGIWQCDFCGLKRPKPHFKGDYSPLPGFYNRYNALAAVASARQLEVSRQIIKKSLTDFSPAFGRQEKFEFRSKQIAVFLSKNPTGFNESLKTVINLKAKTLLIALNDNIPDGRDISWIWDVDFEKIPSSIKVILSGLRVYDLALRFKYAGLKFDIKEDLFDAINHGIKNLGSLETLYCLPTYSAMLQIRNILSGKKIL